MVPALFSTVERPFIYMHECILYPVLLCSLPKSCLLPSFVLVVKYIASESN